MHGQPLKRAGDEALCLKLPLVPYILGANSKGSGLRCSSMWYTPFSHGLAQIITNKIRSSRYGSTLVAKTYKYLSHYLGLLQNVWQFNFYLDLEIYDF